MLPILNEMASVREQKIGDLIGVSWSEFGWTQLSEFGIRIWPGTAN